MIGIVLALLAALWFGSAPYFARLGLRHMSTTAGTLVSMVSALLVVGIIAIPIHRGELLSLPLVLLGWLALLGFLNYPLGRFLNFSGVRLAGVARATPLLATSPLWAMIMAIMFLGETPGLLTALGALSVMGGVALIVREGV